MSITAEIPRTVYPPHDPARDATADGFDDPEITNGIRAQQAADELLDPDSLREDSDYSDLIANILHLAHREGHNPCDIYITALNNFHSEAACLNHQPMPQ